MMSFKAFTLIAVLTATSAWSKPVCTVADAVAEDMSIAGEENFCKEIIISPEVEKQTHLQGRFTKGTDPHNKDIIKFTSALDPEPATYVNFVPRSGAVVVKSDNAQEPQKMRFTYTYHPLCGSEYQRKVYVSVDPKEQCTIKGSKQWSTLDEVLYVFIPDKLD